MTNMEILKAHRLVSDVAQIAEDFGLNMTADCMRVMSDVLAQKEMLENFAESVR